MAVKSSRWCARCSQVHAGQCPNKPVWQKAATARSGRGGRPWQRKRQQVFERDGYQCQECLRSGVITIVALHGNFTGICDHIKPISDGGTDRLSNLQTLCQACSDIKTQAEAQARRGGSKP